MMERDEILELLRETLKVSIVLDDLYESGGTYVTCSVTLRLGDEIISDDYGSVRIGE